MIFTIVFDVTSMLELALTMKLGRIWGASRCRANELKWSSSFSICYSVSTEESPQDLQDAPQIEVLADDRLHDYSEARRK